MSAVRVEVVRGERVESVHQVDLAVTEAERVVTTAGEADSPVYARSAVKPFQAVPLVADGVVERFGVTDEELALCCASHSGEPRHVEVAGALLRRVGLDEDALACGPQAPFSSAAARSIRDAGGRPGRIHNNCSGKHAGMLALARANDWPTADYHRAEHPVQQRLLQEIAAWTGIDPGAIGTAVDGCGVVTFAVPLTALARAFARLAAAQPGSPGGTVVRAMIGHPFLVAGSDRLCTRLIEVTGGRVLAKIGAEGVYGAAALEQGLGIALKARDGARRAAEVALLGVLESLGVLTEAELGALRQWARPEITNTRDERVGFVRPAVELTARRG